MKCCANGLSFFTAVKIRTISMKKYYIEFFIHEQSWYGGYEWYCPDCVNEENVEAWRRYVSSQISKMMKEETMHNEEFQKILEGVRKEKRQREEQDRYREQLRIKQADERKRRSSMERPKITYIPKGLTVDYEEAYGRLIRQEVEFTPTCHDDFLYQRRFLERWYKKSVPQLIAMGRPDAAYGVSVALCKALPRFIFREDLKEMLATQVPQLRKLVVGAFEGLVESVKAWNNEAERIKVCNLLSDEAQRYKDWRGMTKNLIAMIPLDAFTGDPLAVTREMNEDEKYQEYLRQQEEKKRKEAEKESRSLIPLNLDYETKIFHRRNIGWNCDQIWHLMLEENKQIERLAERGHYQEAALRFMQMTKSMCRHFVKDEHYNYFDDMYSPEYAIDDMIDLFVRLDRSGKLPQETKTYLHQAWQEIEESECYQDYGLPRRGF